MRIRRKWWPHYYEMDSAYPKENANQHLPLTKNKKSVEKIFNNHFLSSERYIKNRIEPQVCTESDLYQMAQGEMQFTFYASTIFKFLECLSLQSHH